jgi:hypothetical protein
MTAQQKYYRIAGYVALAVVAVPLIQLESFHIFNYRVFFVFGTIGLLFAISGVWKGQRSGRICAAIALVVWAYLASFFLSTSTLY